MCAYARKKREGTRKNGCEGKRGCMSKSASEYGTSEWVCDGESALVNACVGVRTSGWVCERESTDEWVNEQICK